MTSDVDRGPQTNGANSTHTEKIIETTGEVVQLTTAIRDQSGEASRERRQTLENFGAELTAPREGSEARNWAPQ